MSASSLQNGWYCCLSTTGDCGGDHAALHFALLNGAGIRRTRDPIEHVKTLLQEHGWAEATELKKHDKEVCVALTVLAFRSAPDRYFVLHAIHVGSGIALD